MLSSRMSKHTSSRLTEGSVCADRNTGLTNLPPPSIFSIFDGSKVGRTEYKDATVTEADVGGTDPTVDDE